MGKRHDDLVIRKIGIGILGLVFGLFISTFLLSLIGDGTLGWGLELIGSGFFTWFFIRTWYAPSPRPEQREQDYGYKETMVTNSKR